MCFQSHSSQESLGTLRASVCISKPLGTLFVLLQYQTQAHRIKVMVRKAENLAKLTRIPGAAGIPEFIIFYFLSEAEVKSGLNT